MAGRISGQTGKSGMGRSTTSRGGARGRASSTRNAQSGQTGMPSHPVIGTINVTYGNQGQAGQQRGAQRRGRKAT